MDFFIPMIIFVGILFLIFVISFAFASILSEIESSRKMKKLREDLSSAIVGSQPTWSQLLIVSGTQDCSARDVNRVLSEMYSDALSLKIDALVPHKDLIHSYISQHKKLEPYEGLPAPTKVHLERIAEALNEKSDLLSPLTTQIKEMVSVHESKNRSQRLYTALGFFVGAIGLLFSAYPYARDFYSEMQASQKQTKNIKTAEPEKEQSAI